MPNSTSPDELDNLVEEPDDLEEFIAELHISFQSASASFFEDLKAFRGVPRESLIRLTVENTHCGPLLCNADLYL